MTGATPSRTSVLQASLSTLKPTFLNRHRLKPRTLRPTSYLDGLRGVAALFVVFNHYVAQYFPYITHGWKSGDGSDPIQGYNDRLIQAPIIRSIYSGRFMVTIFFVISGYVLSHKALGLARRRDWVNLLRSLSSSVFRRWLRLMLPALTSAFIGLIIARTGLAHNLYSDWDSAAPDARKTGRVIVEANFPSPEDATFYEFITDSILMMDPFRFGEFKFPTFNFPLWTMQVEFMGSMIVFIVVLGISLARPVFRFAIPSMLVLFCIWTARWHWPLFISGVLLADLSYERLLQPVLPLSTNDEEIIDEKTTSLSLFQKIAFNLPHITAFLLACYLGTYPEQDAESSPGYRQLSKHIPAAWGLFSGYYYPVLGAILLVSVLEHGKFLQKIFTTRIAQYLGDISLSLYMLHVIVELSLGNWLVPKCLAFTSGFGRLGFVLGMSISLSCCAIVTFWAADVFWRLVDVKCVKFARWVSIKCFVEDD